MTTTAVSEIEATSTSTASSTKSQARATRATKKTKSTKTAKAATKSAKTAKATKTTKATKSTKTANTTKAKSQAKTTAKTKTRTTATPAKTSAKTSVKAKAKSSDVHTSGHNKSLGKRGEDAAARFLVNHGYKIISRNYKCQFGEADIIAKTVDAIVFVEVKTRTDEDKGMPEEAVTEKKRSKYEKIAISFLRDYDEVDIAVRFDVVGILVIAPDRAVIRHHINAFGVG